MKIAVPTRNSEVDGHFGHCEYYTVYSVNDSNQVVKKEIINAVEGCGCKSNIAATLQQEEVGFMLAGNIGQGAINMLSMHGIEVIRGCSGDTDKVVTDFLSGKITDSNEVCHHHGESCNH